MNKIVLIDFTHLMYRIYNNNFGMIGEDQNWDFWRYVILTSIKKIIMSFSPNELVLCCDKFSWRKNIFEQYKCGRTKTGDMLDNFFPQIDLFVDELKRNFPYILVRLNGVEADDIIGVLTFNKKPDDLTYIISSDKDFIQLLRYKNVYLYDPIKLEFIGNQFPCIIRKNTFKNVLHYTLTHILGGDSGDGIPNILSDDDTFVTSGKRQKPFGIVKINKVIINEGKCSLTKLTEWLKDQQDNVKENFKRNWNLIMLSENTIPKDIQNKILSEYYNKKNIDISLDKMERYFESKKMTTLYGKSTEFLCIV